MKRLALVLAFAMVVAACGDDDAGTTTTQGTATSEASTTTTTTVAEETTTAADTTTTAAETTTTAAETTTTTVAAGEAIFEITSVGFGAGPMIVIANIGGAAGNLGGHWLCQRPSYFELPDVELQPGEFFAMSLGGTVFIPPPGAITVEGQASLGAINPAGGEVGLYTSNSFGSSDAIESYVEWGNSGHGRSGTAVAAGIWGDGDFVPTTADTVLINKTADGGGAAAWEGF